MSALAGRYSPGDHVRVRLGRRWYLCRVDAIVSRDGKYRVCTLTHANNKTIVVHKRMMEYADV